MSLMHEAIRAMEAPPADLAAVAPTSKPSMRHATPGSQRWWIAGAVLVLVSTATAVAAVFGWQQATTGNRVVQSSYGRTGPQPSPDAAPPLPLPPAAAINAAESMPVNVIAAEQGSQPRRVAATEPAVAALLDTIAAGPTEAVRPPSAAGPAVTVKSALAASMKPPTEKPSRPRQVPHEQAGADQVADVPEVAALPDPNVAWEAGWKAISHENWTAWQEAERALQAAVGDNGLPLLRLRAYAALVRNQDQQAVELYRALLERVPGDEEASVNLSVLYTRAGDAVQAKRVVAAALEVNPESTTLKALMAQLGQ